MRIDVLIPTHNRADLLRTALHSVAAARRPPRAEVVVIVIDNNSSDHTRIVVEELSSEVPFSLRYVFEPNAGRSFALNAGIRSCTGDIVAMFDDDETIEEGWFEIIADAFDNSAVGFMTGPCLPRWGASPPRWIPLRPSAVLGWMEGGDSVRTFGVDYDGVLMGGNAVVRRELLVRVGGYSTALGRTPGGRLMSGEDYDMQVRLHREGATGIYHPRLIIFHYVPPERLTLRYHVRWYFWNAVSRGLADREFPQDVPYLLGIPRYMFGALVRDLASALRAGLSTPRKQQFVADARMRCVQSTMELIGFLFARFRLPA